MVYCVTPRLSRKGSVTFRLLIDGQSQGETIYTAREFPGEKGCGMGVV